MIHVLGLDLSMLSTGWALLDYETGDLVDCGTITTTPDDSPGQRLAHIRDRVMGILNDYRLACVDVALEEGIVHRNRQVSRELAGLYYVIWLACFDRLGVDPIDVNISTAKRAAAEYMRAQGFVVQGAGAKDIVLLTATRRWGERANQNDIADACWIAEVARRQIQRRYADMVEAGE